jgi:hypothetical protein
MARYGAARGTLKAALGGDCLLGLCRRYGILEGHFVALNEVN